MLLHPARRDMTAAHSLRESSQGAAAHHTKLFTTELKCDGDPTVNTDLSSKEPCLGFLQPIASPPQSYLPAGIPAGWSESRSCFGGCKRG